MANGFKALFRPVRKLSQIDRCIRWFMEVLRQWPFVRPRRVVTCAPDWVAQRQKTISWFAARTAPWYREKYPAETHVFPRRDVERGEEVVEFHTMRVWYTKACGLFYFDGAYVLSPDGAVLSSQGDLFDEFSHSWNHGSPRESPYLSPFATFSLRPKRIKHLVATIATIGAENYYHWMFNTVPRFHLLEEVWDSIDYFIISPMRFPFQLESLQAVGMPSNRMIPLAPGTKFMCERIFVPSIGPHDGAAPLWTVDYLRRLFLPNALEKPAVGRKLYLSRDLSYHRSVANEAEVRRLMIDYGFEIVIPNELTIRQQAALFAQASHLVGPHGASFANMVFSSDAIVAEIFAPYHVNVGCYNTLASTCGHRYDYFLGDVVPAADGARMAIKLNLDRLSAWVAGLLR